MQWAQPEISHERPVVQRPAIGLRGSYYIAFVVARCGRPIFGFELGGNGANRYDFDNRAHFFNCAPS